MDVKGYGVDVKGYCVNVKGYGVDVKGNGVNVKGYSVDVKGYSVDAMGTQSFKAVLFEMRPELARRRFLSSAALCLAGWLIGDPAFRVYGLSFCIDIFAGG